MLPRVAGASREPRSYRQVPDCSDAFKLVEARADYQSIFSIVRRPLIAASGLTGCLRGDPAGLAQRRAAWAPPLIQLGTAVHSAVLSALALVGSLQCSSFDSCQSPSIKGETPPGGTLTAPRGAVRLPHESADFEIKITFHILDQVFASLLESAPFLPQTQGQPESAAETGELGPRRKPPPAGGRAKVRSVSIQTRSQQFVRAATRPGHAVGPRVERKSDDSVW